jgi:uncharacterized membrane protein YgdD (TMEM256/DUF423 family)
VIQFFFIFASVSGLVSVLLGAFGAHALRGSIDERAMQAFETGVNYQLTHTLVLLLCCFMLEQWGRQPYLAYAVYAFAAGIVLFSGSLYLISIAQLKWLGPVTPLGGVCLIVGWGLLTLAIWQRTAH